MHIITIKRLKEFYTEYSETEASLVAWSKATKTAQWQNFAQLRKTFNSADQVKNLTVFNVGGNKYRLIALVDYKYQKVYIRHVLTHADYNTRKWKNDSWFE